MTLVKHVVISREAPVPRYWGCLGSTVPNSRSWRWSPAASQRETNSTNSHGNVEVYLSPVKPSDENPALADPWLAACGEPGRRHLRRRQLLQGRSSRSHYSSRRLQVHQGPRQGLPQPRLAEPSQRGCDISILTHRRGRSLTRREFILLTHGHTDGNAGLTPADFRAHPSHHSVLLNHSAPLTRCHSAQSPTAESHGVHHPGVISDLQTVIPALSRHLLYAKHVTGTSPFSPPNSPVM